MTRGEISGKARKDQAHGYYKKDMGMRGGAMYNKGGRVGLKEGNTPRENRLEELGRVDAEKGYTKKGKENLKAEKKRIVKELKA